MRDSGLATKWVWIVTTIFSIFGSGSELDTCSERVSDFGTDFEFEKFSKLQRSKSDFCTRPIPSL